MVVLVMVTVRVLVILGVQMVLVLAVMEAGA